MPNPNITFTPKSLPHFPNIITFSIIGPLCGDHVCSGDTCSDLLLEMVRLRAHRNSPTLVQEGWSESAATLETSVAVSYQVINVCLL